MRAAFWEQLTATGFTVPTDVPLSDLTAELAGLLGATEPSGGREVALEALLRWTDEGVYDGLLEGLGDGMVAGLSMREDGDVPVLRRSASAAVLGACLRRTAARDEVDADTLFRWGDALFNWFLAEDDLRHDVPGGAGAAALAQGADAVAALAAASVFGEAELVAVLDVLAERLARPTPTLLVAEEPDRLAAAAVAVFRRGLVSAEIAEGWWERLEELCGHTPAVAANTRAFLRSLHLQLTVASTPVPDRGDLVLALVGVLRRVYPDMLG